MKYPKLLKDNDRIGITALSSGASDCIEEMDESIKNLEKNFKVFYTKDVYGDSVVSASSLERAKELDELLDEDINLIMLARGGDYLFDCLEYINFDKIVDKNTWIEGASDGTGILYVLTTKYDFATVLTTIINFMSVELSSFYLDLGKDILYCDTFKSKRRMQVQNVLNTVLDTLMRLLTPIIPHTMDELYTELGGKEKSVQLLSMPEREEVNTELLKEFELLLTLRADVLKAIEVKRGEGLIKSSQEVSLELEVVDSKVKEVFNKLSDLEQKRLFIVSDVVNTKVSEDYKQEVSNVKVSVHNGVKCERCWNRFKEEEVHDCLCERCSEAMKFYEDLE